tara:strand:+ start:529 stop:816 length:288 start_codon:yes stop_codon:yes gene_type:complete
MNVNKTFQYNEKQQHDECIICLEDLKKELINLKCGHSFHYKCLNDWINNKKYIGPKDLICPICQQPIIINKIFSYSKYYNVDEQNDIISADKIFN